MKLVVFFFLILLSLGTSSLYATSLTHEKFTDYDLRFYHPENYGLKDLVFEVRIENLTRELNKAKSYGKLEDVYFKVFWMFPGQYKIIANGLPGGFKELRSSLKNQIKSRLSFVIPIKIYPLLRSFNIKKVSKSGSNFLRATPKVNGGGLKFLDFNFLKNGQLAQLDSISDLLHIKTNYEHKIFPWSKKKWVLNKLIEKRMQSKHQLTMESLIAYKKNNGYGFPERIEVITTPYIDLGKSSIKNNNNSISSVFVFSKYEINTGKAKKAISK